MGVHTLYWGKVELFKLVDDLDKDIKDVRVLVGENAGA